MDPRGPVPRWDLAALSRAASARRLSVVGGHVKNLVRNASPFSPILEEAPMPLSRRGFLHSSFAAGVAVTAGSQFARAEDKPAADAGAKPAAPGQASFPTDKIRVAVMGCGGRGGTHVD